MNESLIPTGDEAAIETFWRGVWAATLQAPTPIR
jgi:hypothetical protein